MYFKYTLGQAVRVKETQQVGHVKAMKVSARGSMYCLDNLPVWLDEEELEALT